MLNPEEPSVKSYKKKLGDIDFPMILRLCLQLEDLDGNDTRLMSIGYENIRKYFKGNSYYNDSVIGWAGHTEKGSTVGSVEGTW